MQEQQLIKDSVRKLYEAQQQVKEVQAYYNEVKRVEQLKITNYMFTHLPKDTNKFDIVLDDGMNYYKNHLHLNVTSVRRKKIFWHLDKLKKKLSKETIKQVVNKTYTITDMQGLIKYLKECGVDPKKFKKYIDVQEELNEAELDRMYTMGEIDKKDIVGCYTMEVSEPYIKFTKKQEGQTDE